MPSEDSQYKKLVRELQQVERGMPVIVGFQLDESLPKETLHSRRDELRAYGVVLNDHLAAHVPDLVSLEVRDMEKARALLERLNPHTPVEKRLEGIVLYDVHHSEFQVATGSWYTQRKHAA